MTKKGKDLQDDALRIPEELVCSLGLDMKDGIGLLDDLHRMMKILVPTSDDE